MPIPLLFSSLLIYTLLWLLSRRAGRKADAIRILLFVFSLVLGFIWWKEAWHLYLLIWVCPILGITVMLLTYIESTALEAAADVFTVNLAHRKGVFRLQNMRRGVSVIGAAGSGKTQSVLAQILIHAAKQGLSGVIHDYKDFELTELAYPLLDTKRAQFYCISFDPVYHRVNPIAPRYLPSAEAINEIVHVLISNLLEQKEDGPSGTGKFFTDAVEGLLAGMIWRLRTDYPRYCTLPHLIALYQQLPQDSLVAFLNASAISQGLSSAFLQGIASERQTAGVMSTLANALKKISTFKIFYVLSEDEVPLGVNSQAMPTWISLVNNPQYESAYAPVLATVMHAITKQMAVRGANPSFILMEEAPTIRLYNMHRIPATLRSYDIATIYVMQDKIQNDLMYGEKAGKAILSNLSYQFFGKVNDPDTAKYYEQFFEIIKKPTRSVNRSHTINFDTRVTTGEREVSKVRADVFFRLKPGEFIAFADGQEARIWFEKPQLMRGLPKPPKAGDLAAHYSQIYEEARSIFQAD
ncbi:type IV secretion system DNA-binding domain-containing protein [Robiginitalea sp. M366]|uniref:type IV secretory system conjugative DNA transfer family protein n=1 Tax=Robiginitalea aestuariiviva TaxID=3036903 RepID=UPI00240D0137|nr:type IV secretion system DNA-binding domain-containing protein [Robiginitalea aestuariiviva]MDG1573296.1 type IV secretion system DNA-binding domain-containing protein [Robiginitalea aestuariiviva]